MKELFIDLPCHRTFQGIDFKTFIYGLRNIYKNQNYSPIKIESLIGKGRSQLNMGDITTTKIKDYACEDACI